VNFKAVILIKFAGYVAVSSSVKAVNLVKKICYNSRICTRHLGMPKFYNFGMPSRSMEVPLTFTYLYVDSRRTGNCRGSGEGPSNASKFAGHGGFCKHKQKLVFSWSQRLTEKLLSITV